MVAGFALDPYNVASGIDYYVLVSRWASDADSDEVFSASLVHAGDYVGAECLWEKGGFFGGDAAEEGGDPFGVSGHSCIESGSVVVGGVKGGNFVSVE